MRRSVPAQPQRRGSIIGVPPQADYLACGPDATAAAGIAAAGTIRLEAASPSRQNSMVVPWLRTSSLFPPIDAALDDPNGLLAAGGDLSAERLIDAYSHGIFPWYNGGQPILWWSPNPRMVLFIDEFTVPRSLRKVVRQRRFELRIDTEFGRVMAECAAPRPGQSGT